ncbi:hypothetical protein HOG48_05975 [Candidatus Peregrinibacteria bacterium]|jgi:hypothetical protein|nr:hypothetical protein [Candidatus Peregrinibacteria bacterium]
MLPESDLQKVTFADRAARAGESVTVALRSLNTVSTITIVMIQIMVFTALCVAYLAYSNRYITQGYLVNKFEAERAQLIVQNEVSNRLLEEAKSLSAMRDRAHQYMVYSHDHTYIEPHDTHVAMVY